MVTTPTDITRMLAAMDEGDEEVLPKLLSAVYDELHGLAERHLKRERRDHTLQATALLNEAYLRLVDQRNQDWKNRSHFLAVASTAMRRVLLHHARSHLAQKRGGDHGKVTLFEAASVFEERAEDLVALDEALEKLSEFDPQNARVVELRFFGGLKVEETAEILGISTRSVERGWRVARAWLRQAMEPEDG